MSKEQMEGYVQDLEKAAKNGTHEVFDTSSDINDCKKVACTMDLSDHEDDPCVEDFVSVDSFDQSYLPQGYRGEDLEELVSVLSKLTVKLVGKQECKVKKPSKECTGTVFKVDMHTVGTGDKTVCPCPGHKSDTPSKMVWWKVHVRTTRDFVELFEKMDPKNFKFTTNYNLNEEDEMLNITLDCIHIPPLNNGEKSCVLEFATHNVKFGYNLRDLCQQFQDLHRTVYEKYRANTDVNLTIIISYPHGQSDPQVSIGHWVHRAVTDGRTWYMYTTPTCPGSAGALVYRVGQELGDDVHVGVTSDGLNFSG